MLKSPMNYIGNKYRILDQIMPYFPESKTMMDLFAGGLDVSINYKADRIICNDINNYVIDIYKTMQSMTYEQVMEYLLSKTDEYQLSKTNKEGYIAFRDYYNKSDRYPLDLYLLMNYSFNYQIRFNNNHEYNNPFGKDRSSFNPVLQSRLKDFMELIKPIEFISSDFREVDYSMLNQGEFIYCDPAYSLSIGSYNDGKRGFKGWNRRDDIDLMNLLDELSNRGIIFALSNVVEHKGVLHEELLSWSEKYRLINIKCSYDNCNYQSTNKQYKTREVLITNKEMN